MFAALRKAPRPVVRGCSAELDGPGDSENNYGVYAIIDGGLAEGAWSVRLVLANEEVSQTAGFASYALD